MTEIKSVKYVPQEWTKEYVEEGVFQEGTLVL